MYVLSGQLPIRLTAQGSLGSWVHFPAFPGAGPKTHHSFQEKALCLVLQPSKGKMHHSATDKISLYIELFLVSLGKEHSPCSSLFLSAAFSRGPQLAPSTLFFDTVFKVGTNSGEEPLLPTEVFFQFSSSSTNQQKNKFMFIQGFGQDELDGFVLRQLVEDI